MKAQYIVEAIMDDTPAENNETTEVTSETLNGMKEASRMPEETKEEGKGETARDCAVVEAKEDDPLLALRCASKYVRRGDYVVLLFGDGRHVFAQAGSPVKLNNKRTYRTNHLAGLPYGTLLEVERSYLKVLPNTESIVPSLDLDLFKDNEDEDEQVEEPPQPSEGETADTENKKKKQKKRDNRHLEDNNTSQGLSQAQVMAMRQGRGKEIVQELIQNSATFASKTDFSKAKYVQKKQQKYMPRCRIVPCTANTISEALFQKDPKKYLNLRADTLGQLLAHANLTAGCHVLIWEEVSGLVAGAVVERLAGYGKVFSIYTGQQPASNEVLLKFNFPLAFSNCLQWVHVGDVLNPTQSAKIDVEALDRNSVKWPCPLQAHTKQYLKDETAMGNNSKKLRRQVEFLDKRAGRFTRKLTRPSPLESIEQLRNRQVDSLVLAVRNYNATDTLLELLPFLQPSCPFVVFCEYLEPLVQCFAALQTRQIAIYLRLTTAWTRSYQVLPGRTHPNMNMTQNGGYLLTGMKLDPTHGIHELSETKLAELRATLPTRRGKKRKPITTATPKDNTATNS